MQTKTAWLVAVGALVASAGGYLVIATREPTAVEPTDSPRGLARWSGAESNPTLLAEALSTESDGAVRHTLLERAARRSDALALFRAAWDATDDNTVREQLLVDAARLGVLGAAGWLAEVAASDHVLATRAGAALGTITDRRAAAELVRLGSDDGPALVRANAVRALGSAGSAEHVPVLSRLVSDPSQPLRVRQEAALSIGHLHDPSASPGLVTALDAARADSSANGEQLRISLIQSLEALGTRDAREALQVYANGNPSRTEAAFLQRALARR